MQRLQLAGTLVGLTCPLRPCRLLHDMAGKLAKMQKAFRAKMQETQQTERIERIEREETRMEKAYIERQHR